MQDHVSAYSLATLMGGRGGSYLILIRKRYLSLELRFANESFKDFSDHVDEATPIVSDGPVPLNLISPLQSP